MTRGNPHFDLDLRYGLYGEDTVAAMLGAVGEMVEVKSPRNSRLTFYLETHCNKGRRTGYQPSGIRTSRASVWIYNFMDPTQVQHAEPARVDRTPTCCFVMRRQDLIDYIDGGFAQEDTFDVGNNPTKGVLISVRLFVAWLVSGKPPQAAS